MQVQDARTAFHPRTLPLAPMSRRQAPFAPEHVLPFSRRALRALRCSVTCAAALLAASSALAHPAPFSYVDLRLAGRAIDGTLVVHMFDAGHDLGIDPPERLLTPSVAAAHAQALAALLSPRLIVTADGRALRGGYQR